MRASLIKAQELADAKNTVILGKHTFFQQACVTSFKQQGFNTYTIMYAITILVKTMNVKYLSTTTKRTLDSLIACFTGKKSSMKLVERLMKS